MMLPGCSMHPLPAPSHFKAVAHQHAARARPVTKAQPKSCSTGTNDCACGYSPLQLLAQRALAGLCSLALLSGPPLSPPASATEAPPTSGAVTIAFPASKDPDIRAAQQLLVEVWAYTGSVYLDPTMNGLDWKAAGEQALANSFKAKSPADVVAEADALLQRLNDPFTRILSPQDAKTFELEQDGKVLATGIRLETFEDGTASRRQQQLADTSSSRAISRQADVGAASAGPGVTRSAEAAVGGTGMSDVDAYGEGGGQRLRVSGVAEPSPAAAAGVRVGDELLEVDGAPVAGQAPRQVYRLLSQNAELTLLRKSAEDGTASGQRIEVRLQPAPLNFTPVQYALLQVDSSSNNSSRGSSSSSSSSSGGRAGTSASNFALASASGSADSTSSVPAAFSRALPAPSAPIGYIRLIAFTQTAPAEVDDAIRELQAEGAEAIILDLRDNPGGVVGSGVELARSFMADGDVLCYALDRSGLAERAAIEGAHTLVSAPVAVLVNGASASTSELLAAALHDNSRAGSKGAVLVGERTFGKGRTQRVLPVSGGYDLLVSTMQFLTPQQQPVDRVGLSPDVACVPERVENQRWSGGGVAGGSLLADPCVRMAAEALGATLAQPPATASGASGLHS